MMNCIITPTVTRAGAAIEAIMAAIGPGVPGSHTGMGGAISMVVTTLTDGAMGTAMESSGHV